MIGDLFVERLSSVLNDVDTTKEEDVERLRRMLELTAVLCGVRQGSRLTCMLISILQPSLLLKLLCSITKNLSILKPRQVASFCRYSFSPPSIYNCPVRRWRHFALVRTRIQIPPTVLEFADDSSIYPEILFVFGRHGMDRMEELCIVPDLQVHHQAGLRTLPARTETVFSFLRRVSEGKTS